MVHDNGEAILKGLPLNEGTCVIAAACGATAGRFPYKGVQLWVEDNHLHMHDGETLFVKRLDECLSTTGVSMIDWIETNCRKEAVSGP